MTTDFDIENLRGGKKYKQKTYEVGKNTYSAHSKAHILVGVMIVNVSVSLGLHPHVKEAMRC